MAFIATGAQAQFVDDYYGFPGGEVAMYDFFDSNIKYPENLKAQKISGLTYVTLNIDKKGKPSDIHVSESSGYPEFDEEALRVVKLVKKWVPGKVKGKVASTELTVPVQFKVPYDQPTIDGDDDYYPGGEKAMQAFFEQHMKYPEDALKAGIHGVLYVNLTIDEQGKGSNIRISSPSQYPSLDAEAVRLVKLVDHWNPIIISGKAVKDESAIVPVKFRLPQPPEDQVEEVVVHKTVTEVNEPYVPVQKTLAKNPTYPGGMVEMTKFISSQTKYPKKELKENIEGDVKVKFMVQEDGSISNIQVIEHVSPGLDAEAVRIVNTMPKWNPAVATDGTTMPCEMSIPVNFRTPKAIDGYVWPQYQNKK